MSLNKALETLKLDKRLLELNLKQGRITKEEYDQAQKSLPDLQDQCEKLDLEKDEKKLN